MVGRRVQVQDKGRMDYSGGEVSWEGVWTVEGWELGLRKMQNFNPELLGKWLWRLASGVRSVMEEGGDDEAWVWMGRGYSWVIFGGLKE
ncbi:unnamed protein product [Ilex paraguariensis]|uniref:Uncharacterized protein n=1 Tax=Ilex paraguariensis TaxID=185542 RepID=A0ABC8RTA7_9AQUA